jgi:hypothetical protein
LPPGTDESMTALGGATDMNLHTTARKILTATAVTLISTAALSTANISTSASADQHRSDSVSATQEYKPAGTSTARRTKEW